MAKITTICSLIRRSLTRPAFALLLLAIAPAAAQTQPPESTAAVELGRRLFQTHCTYCHGAHGEGGRGPDLTTGRFKHGGSGPEIFASIRNGIRGTEMAPVRAADDDVWRMVAFVRTLSNVETTEPLPGDPAAGKALFESTGKCATCHSIGKTGGVLGPDLTGVGLRRPAAFLRESLLKPEAVVPVSYRALRLVPRSGQPVAGIRLNEDDISIQIRDTAGNLRSFLKANLREIIHQQPALMPSYESMLTPRQLDDLVAYLSSLREDRP